MKKHLALFITCVALSLLGAAAHAQKAQRTIKTTYVSPTQAIISCSNGRLPVAKEAAGSLIVTCEREQK